MLKIKDNIDLKELEKFGFEIENRYIPKHYYYRYNNRFAYLLKINIETKRLILNSLNKDTLDKIFDLIQAGLVEKI